ncbi:MAG: glycosyltransferase family 4 protein [Chitinispirillaceae bacterium]|nr:glycosyltransferase family 4 protein [Chitinispirillaceae bacterium]
MLLIFRNLQYFDTGIADSGISPEENETGHLFSMGTSAAIKRIAFVGNYLPRQCGIATFTTDLCESFAAAYPLTSCIALPVNDIEGGYPYPPRVRFELAEKDIRSYRRAADFLNINNVDLVCLQHEFGIFGGRAGGYLLALLEELRMPVVTTLHTILDTPDADQSRVLKQVASLSDRLVVMSGRGIEFLTEVYGVSVDKIDMIPHGIPDVPFVDPSFHKDLFGVEGKILMLSFGLLSANKGIENVIKALPAILAGHPNVVYIVLGATHPHVLHNDGESYRLSLQWLAQENGVEGQVVFYNRFVSLEELNEFIGAADIYITPYLNAAQITSGTLAYTLGAGKAVVSTPYWYAQEMLDEGRGVIVPFGDFAELARRVNMLLDNEAERHAMRKRAYLHGRSMIWPRVVERYHETFRRARAERRNFTIPGFTAKALDKSLGELPPLKLNHLHRLTDETGMLQHAVFTIPNYHEGYTTDDNARALMVSVLLEATGGNGAVFDLASRYLAFVWYAFNTENGRFRNFMDYRRNWLDCGTSDDCHGRTLWSLGTVLGRSTSSKLHNMAGWLFEKALPSIISTTSPRAWAFTLIGIHEYLRRFDGDRKANQVREELAERLRTMYNGNRTSEWRWYEGSLTYCNAALSQAMIMSGHWIPDTDMMNEGFESLRWLTDLQRDGAEGGHFVPVGSNGFYKKGSERARFDQQPVEAQTMVSACLEAYRISGDKKWHKEARRAFEWFLGRNDLNLPLYDPTTGGCRDGLHPDRPNENQGAESTLAFLQALMELRLAENIQPNGG